MSPPSRDTELATDGEVTGRGWWRRRWLRYNLSVFVPALLVAMGSVIWFHLRIPETSHLGVNFIPWVLTDAMLPAGLYLAFVNACYVLVALGERRVAPPRRVRYRQSAYRTSLVLGFLTSMVVLPWIFLGTAMMPVWM